MIDNPYNWYLECGEYAIENKNSMDYGFLFLIDNNAPDSVKKSYRKYLDLCIKPFLSMNLHIIKNNHIVGFSDTDNSTELEQIKLFNKLVEKGFINNDVYPPTIKEKP